MADYIYTMESRLTPDQQKGVNVVQDVTRAAGMNLYLTGGAVRDIISGFPIRDLDFTVQGNPLKLQKELERAGAVIASADEDTKTLYLQLPGNVRAEISMARIERYEKTGKPPIVTPATIIEDLRRRDLTINAMALSLPEAELIGEGEAWVLTAGRLIKGHWSRPTDTQTTTYTLPSGEPIRLTPGRTWLELVPLGNL